MASFQPGALAADPRQQMEQRRIKRHAGGGNLLRAAPDTAAGLDYKRDRRNIRFGNRLVRPICEHAGCGKRQNNNGSKKLFNQNQTFGNDGKQTDGRPNGFLTTPL